MADLQEILGRPSLAYQEGMRFLRGKGMINDALKRLARDLDAHEIPYCVIGAIALNRHGYQRFTHDIDLLMTREGLERFVNELVGLGYRPAFAGASKTFRAFPGNVPVEIIISGEYPGDGQPKPVAFPEPVGVSVEIDGVKTIALEKLVDLKLASGMTGLDRLKDLADVQELIRTLDLDAAFAERLDPFVRDTYFRLHAGIVGAQTQNTRPDSEH